MGVVSVPHLPIPEQPGSSGRPRSAVSEAQAATAHLVRVIAADPTLVGWLREYGARLLDGCAAQIRAAQTGGEVDGALVAARLAAEHRAGTTALW
jgi:hypothetical protein